MCVYTHIYICMSLVSILASWYIFVLVCFGGRMGCVKLGIFQGSTSLGCWTEDGNPVEMHCCVSILLCCLSMPCESTNHNLRSHSDFGIFIRYNTWFICTAWLRVAFPFHSTPTSLHELTEAKKKEQKESSEGFWVLSSPLSMEVCLRKLRPSCVIYQFPFSFWTL